MEITAQDLEIVVKIIDTVAERGAFKGEELAIVGSIRNKFASVLQSFDQEQTDVFGDGELQVETEVVEEVVE